MGSPEVWALVISGLAAFAACASCYISWRTRKDMDKINLPVPSVRTTRSAPGQACELFLGLTHEPRWLLNAVSVRKARPCRVLANPDVRDQGPETTGQWQERIAFDPPVEAGRVLVHVDAPSRFDLRVDVSLKSDSRFRKSLKMRIGLPD